EKGKGKRTAVLTGGGAAVGGIIGALAGGGKGAAIGAAAGAGAGAGGSALTGNKDIVLPAESDIAFELSAPLDIRRESRVPQRKMDFHLRCAMTQTPRQRCHPIRLK